MKRKKETIRIMSTYENTMINKERYNPFQSGHGMHESEKYPKRSKSKAKWKKESREFI